MTTLEEIKRMTVQQRAEYVHDILGMVAHFTQGAESDVAQQMVDACCLVLGHPCEPALELGQIIVDYEAALVMSGMDIEASRRKATEIVNAKWRAEGKTWPAQQADDSAAARAAQVIDNLLTVFELWQQPDYLALQDALDFIEQAKSDQPELPVSVRVTRIIEERRSKRDAEKITAETDLAH